MPLISSYNRGPWRAPNHTIGIKMSGADSKLERHRLLWLKWSEDITHVNVYDETEKHHYHHVVFSVVLGVEHFSQQRVAGQIPKKMALVQILLNLQADAAYLRKPQQQLTKLVWVSRVDVVSVLHQGSIHPLLDLLHLTATLQVLHICTDRHGYGLWTHPNTHTLSGLWKTTTHLGWTGPDI